MKRAITYQMAKNKGLTPQRKKEQRNPRVKHRNKYKKAIIRRKGAVSFIHCVILNVVSLIYFFNIDERSKERIIKVWRGNFRYQGFSYKECKNKINLKMITICFLIKIFK